MFCTSIVLCLHIFAHKIVFGKAYCYNCYLPLELDCLVLCLYALFDDCNFSLWSAYEAYCCKASSRRFWLSSGCSAVFVFFVPPPRFDSFSDTRELFFLESQFKLLRKALMSLDDCSIFILFLNSLLCYFYGGGTPSAALTSPLLMASEDFKFSNASYIYTKCLDCYAQSCEAESCCLI